MPGAKCYTRSDRKTNTHPTSPPSTLTSIQPSTQLTQKPPHPTTQSSTNTPSNQPPFNTDHHTKIPSIQTSIQIHLSQNTHLDCHPCQYTASNHRAIHYLTIDHQTSNPSQYRAIQPITHPNYRLSNQPSFNHNSENHLSSQPPTNCPSCNHTQTNQPHPISPTILSLAITEPL